MKLLDLLFPLRCPFCRAFVEREGLCPECQRSLPWLEGQRAQRKLDHLELCASALAYRGNVRACVLRYKFRRRNGYARVLGLLVAQCAQDHLPQSFDLISWPPLSAKRLRHRGFDQARLLARAVAQARGVQETALFKKRRDNRRQSSLQDPAARRANVLGVYELLFDKDVRGKTVLLVDDVVTTGSTLCECARVLLTAGAKGVWAVTLASAQGHDT